MYDRREQFRIDTREPGEHVRIDLVRLANAVCDHSKIARIGHDHLVTPLPKQLTHPPRVSPHFDGDARRRKILKMASHRLGCRPQTALGEYLSIGSQYTAVAETISEIDPNRDLLCRRVKTWLQLLAFGQRSIPCHWTSSLPAFYHSTLAPSHPIFLPFPACFFLHL